MKYLESISFLRSNLIHIFNKNKKNKAIIFWKLGFFIFAILFIINNSFCKENNSFIVSQIIIDGCITQNCKEKIYSSLNIKAGQNLDKQFSIQAIQKLYSTGFFNHIQFYQSVGNTLRVKVVERPIIKSISFKGNSKIKNENLEKFLKENGLYVGNFLSSEVLFRIKHSLLMQYALMGHYSINLNIKKEINNQNQAEITIYLNEGKTVLVKRVNILGNIKYSDKYLLDKLDLQSPKILNFWGFFNSKTNYLPIKMQSSIEKLTNIYMNSGYLDFHIVSHNTSLSPDKKNAYINFDINEGNIYKVNSIKLDGDIILPKNKLEKMFLLNKGDFFSRKKVLNTINSITKALGDIGYGSATVDPLLDINKENHTVHLTFYIKAGKKLHINQINFLGNNITNDSVYRRQIQYYESGVYNQKLVDQSKIKLQRMPFVKNVKLKKIPVLGTNDLINMNYQIEERNANIINASIGYSQLSKFMIGSNLNLPNLLGTGNQLSIGANLSSAYQSLNFIYTNPFFSNSGISQTISFYLSKNNYNNTSISSYHLNKYGANLSYNIPVSSFSSINIGGTIDHTQWLKPSKGKSSIMEWFISNNKNRNIFNTVTLNFGWNYNSTDRDFFPTLGNILLLNFTASIPGSNLQWYKTSTSIRIFHSIIDNCILSIKGSLEYGDGYGKTQYFPLFQNFYGGGWGSIRGFIQGGMGLVDLYKLNDGNKRKGNPIGGNLNIYSNIDILIPIPGMKDSQNMRAGIFFDIGNIYNTYSVPSETLWSTSNIINTPSLSNLRYSIGVQFQWLSPIGPLALSLTKPLNARNNDSTQVFQFTVGQTF